LACRKTEKHHRPLQKKLERFCGRKHLSQRDTSEQVMRAPGTGDIVNAKQQIRSTRDEC